MLKYIIIPLSQESTSFCNYHPKSDSAKAKYISPEILSKIIFWAMKENLSVQFVYPDSPCPDEIQNIVRSIDHVKIVPESHEDTNLCNDADIIVSDNVLLSNKLNNKIYILRLTFTELIGSIKSLEALIKRSIKVNAIITDIESFTKDSIEYYRSFLDKISDFVASEIINGNNVQFNLITDRMMLSKMNNCNAGNESITASVDGTFFPCPAFTGMSEYNCGNVNDGLNAPNIRLFHINNAPICKICDAFQCKRCVWLNNSLTHEVNTPGWQQCVISHLERHAAKYTLEKIRRHIPDYLTEIIIPTIDYIDPYTKIEQL